jgi:hypothetical protein
MYVEDLQNWLIKTKKKKKKVIKNIQLINYINIHKHYNPV